MKTWIAFRLITFSRQMSPLERGMYARKRRKRKSNGTIRWDILAGCRWMCEGCGVNNARIVFLYLNLSVDCYSLFDFVLF